VNNGKSQGKEERKEEGEVIKGTTPGRRGYFNPRVYNEEKLFCILPQQPKICQ